jgi:hypothetical protein
MNRGEIRLADLGYLGKVRPNRYHPVPRHPGRHI